MTNVLGHSQTYQNMNCRPDRSETQWSDLQLILGVTNLDESASLPFVIPSNLPAAS